MKKSPSPGSKTRKAAYLEWYEKSKKGGEPFFPDTVARDALVALLVVGVIFALAFIHPARSEPPADPTSTSYNPRPEWYFLFFFQFLKLFPGYLEALAAAVLPMIALILLALVPFLDRSDERRWSRRRPMITAGVLVVLLIGVLEFAGAISAPAQPAGEESLLVQGGRRVYREVNCTYCHSVGGVGGSIGPDLTDVGARMDREALEFYLRNPHAMVPTTLHPKLQFTEDEMDALVAYLGTLGEQAPFSGEAPALYEKYCSSCHIVNGRGGTLGPDLSTVGSRRTVGFLQAYTADPKSVLPGATMPGFRGTLSDEQIRDIAAYLYGLKGGAPAPPPAQRPP